MCHDWQGWLESARFMCSSHESGIIIESGWSSLVECWMMDSTNGNIALFIIVCKSSLWNKPTNIPTWHAMTFRAITCAELTRMYSLRAVFGQPVFTSRTGARCAAATSGRFWTDWHPDTRRPGKSPRTAWRRRAEAFFGFVWGSRSGGTGELVATFLVF